METFSALLAICAGNSPIPGEFPAQRPVTRSFDVFFDLRLNKRLSKQSWGCWWFETLSRPLWRHTKECGGGISVYGLQREKQQCTSSAQNMRCYKHHLFSLISSHWDGYFDIWKYYTASQYFNYRVQNPFVKLVPDARLNIKMSSYQYMNPLYKIRRSHRLIFIIEFHTGKTVFILRRRPGLV